MHHRLIFWHFVHNNVYKHFLSNIVCTELKKKNEFTYIEFEIYYTVEILKNVQFWKSNFFFSTLLCSLKL